MKLYELSNEMQSLKSLLDNAIDFETGEIKSDEFLPLSEQLNDITVSFEEKAVGVATVYRDLLSDIELIKAEEKRLSQMRKTAEKKTEFLKQYLSDACMQTGITKIDGVSAKISFRSSEKTVIDNLDAVPEEFLKIEYKPDLTAIKNALKSGKEIDGAHIEKTQNIQIK